MLINIKNKQTEDDFSFKYPQKVIIALPHIHTPPQETVCTTFDFILKTIYNNGILQ